MASVPLFFAKEEERSGKTRLCWNGIPVSFILNLTRYILTISSAWFRLFVGDLSNDVSDDVLANAFNKYTSFQKARVIRDRLSQKVRRWFLCICFSLTHFLLQAKYGFVAFSDPEDFLKAWKEMDGMSLLSCLNQKLISFSGKCVGNRPVKLKRADDTAIRPVEIGHRKARQLEKDLKKNRGKPY